MVTGKSKLIGGGGCDQSSEENCSEQSAHDESNRIMNGCQNRAGSVSDLD
jgi:hypothetical protein